MPINQRFYQNYLEGMVLARTEQLRAADACLEQVATEIQKVRARLRAEGLSDELSKIESLVQKARSFEKVA